MSNTRHIRSLTATPVLTGVSARLTRALGIWTARRQQRSALARLDAHLLRDIGLDAAHAQDEARKQFWQD